MQGADACSICLDSYTEGAMITSLPCSHSFHTDCLEPWCVAALSVLHLHAPPCTAVARSLRPALLQAQAERHTGAVPGVQEHHFPGRAWSRAARSTARAAAVPAASCITATAMAVACCCCCWREPGQQAAPQQPAHEGRPEHS